MKHALWVLMLFAVPAMAELPPLTPQEKAKFEADDAKEAAMLEHQKQALARVQERIARQYRAGPPAVEEKVGKSDVPKSATQPLGTPAKPHAGREVMPQAEAHSQSAD